MPLFLVGDLGGGSISLLTGVLAALHRAGRTGQGDVVDAAIVDGASQLMATAYAGHAAGEWEDRRAANLLDSGRAWYDVYATADGKSMSVGPSRTSSTRSSCALLEDCSAPGGGGCRSDPDRWPALRQLIAARFASRTRAEWESVFGLSDACVATVLSLKAPRHPHLVAAARSVEADGRPQPGASPRFQGISAADARALRRTLASTPSRMVFQEWGVTAESRPV